MKFYSEKLNKMFDTDKELLLAEEAAFKAEQEKKAQALAKKTDAKKVEDAFKAHNAAKKVFNENFTKLRKAYAADLAALKETFDKAVAVETEKLSTAEKAYTTALSEFTKNHPEGYHMTLRDGDHVVTLSNNSQVNSTNLKDALSIFDLMSGLFNI